VVPVLEDPEEPEELGTGWLEDDPAAVGGIEEPAGIEPPGMTIPGIGLAVWWWRFERFRFGGRAVQ
jgi:hypothetical protein